jgi:large subunit ribosomal protein L17
MMLASQVVGLIQHGRITTTLERAKATRPIAEKMITLGKEGGLPARRRAIQVLNSAPAVKHLFTTVAPAFADRKGGYTRIVRLGRRVGDGAETAILEWTNFAPPAPKAKNEGKAKAASKTAESAK